MLKPNHTSAKDRNHRTMSNKQRTSTDVTIMQPPISMNLNALTRSALRSRQSAAAAQAAAMMSSMNPLQQQREQVSAFRQALHQSGTLSLLTLPDYSLPGLSPDQQLQLILQDAMLNADMFFGDLPDIDDEGHE